MRGNTHISSNSWRRLFVAVVVSFVVSASGVAQNNPYKITDSLYPLYQEAYKYRYTEKGLKLADQMYQKAQAIGDDKAECLALSVRMLYYSNKNDDEKFFRAVKAMEDKALATGYKQYYYFGLTTRVNYLTSRNRLYEALVYLNDFEKQARKNNDMYGVFYGLNSLAQVYMVRKELNMAIATLNDALEVGQKYVKDQDMAIIYRKLSLCYNDLFEYSKMYEMAEKGYSIAKTIPSKQQLLRNMAFAQFKLHNYAKVSETYQLYLELLGGEIDVNGTESVNYEMVVMLLIAENRLDEATKWLDAKKSGNRKEIWQRLYMGYKYRVGDYADLADLKNAFYISRIVHRDSIDAEIMKGVNAKLVNQRLELDKQQLEIGVQQEKINFQRNELLNANLQLTNSQLTLHNASLELGKTKADAERLRLYNDNKQLDSDLLHSRIKAFRASKTAAELKMWTAVAVVAVLFIAAILILIMYRKMTRRLKATHQLLANNNIELVEARNHAVAASRVKTEMVQNMSRDVNIPLESICGFARMLAESNGQYTAAQCHEYYKQVLGNTKQLLDIVGEALDKTQKRS